ncbi:DUF5753 domain-containing protein [Streptomyces hoynatensis]|uniref:DUF5753 domain-containing protein n=1 Tax=Streptomyces hoynatensis TaxID=1141874 RepID=UPI001F4EA557|nr:DUF5753 domain-containing protein [Streptomyces hoynatensis]
MFSETSEKLRRARSRSGGGKGQAKPVAEEKPGEDFSPLRRFGADVRRVRLGRRLTQAQLGQGVGYSVAYVSGVESGNLTPSHRFAEGCDKVFGTNGLFTGLLHRLEQGEHPSAFMPFVQLEAQARVICAFSNIRIAGIVQTEAYARAIFRAGWSDEPDEVIEDKVALRIRRQHVLAKKRPPRLWLILHESCLRMRVGGPEVMAEQLDRLVHLAARPGVNIQVITFEAGAEGAHVGPFTLLTVDGDSPVLYTDDPQGGRLFRSGQAVESCVRFYDRLRAHAASPTDSVALIQAAREEVTR